MACYWGLRVFVTINGQDGGGCRATNLRYLATLLARACFTVHTPLMLSFKIPMLSLKCRSADRGGLIYEPEALCAGAHKLCPCLFLCELLTIVVNFMFRRTMY